MTKLTHCSVAVNMLTIPSVLPRGGFVNMINTRLKKTQALLIDSVTAQLWLGYLNCKGQIVLRIWQSNYTKNMTNISGDLFNLLRRNSDFCLLEFYDSVYVKIGSQTSSICRLCFVSHKLPSFLTILPLHFALLRFITKSESAPKRREINFPPLSPLGSCCQKEWAFTSEGRTNAAALKCCLCSS